jgi:hypothetical protein
MKIATEPKSILIQLTGKWWFGNTWKTGSLVCVDCSTESKLGEKIGIIVSNIDTHCVRVMWQK